MIRDVSIFPYGEHVCYKCQRFVCNKSRWSRLWHRITRWHNSGFLLKDATVHVSGYWDDPELGMFTGPAQPQEK